MSGRGNQGTYVHLGSDQTPEDPRAPAVSTIPPSQQLKQPLLTQYQQGYGAHGYGAQGYGATSATLNSISEDGASSKPMYDADPAPENRKGDRVCRQAPEDRQFGPVEQPPRNQQPPQPPPIRQQPVLRKFGPAKTSVNFKMETLDDNQYYLSILLCITLMVVCNPVSLLCCIPAFHFAMKASDENEKEDYEQAHKYHRTAGLLNAGGLINIIVGGPLLLFFISFVISFVI